MGILSSCDSFRYYSDRWFSAVILTFTERKFLRAMATSFKESKVLTKVKDTDTESKNCPKCGSRMVLRNERYGPFFGCSKYPYCRGTRNC